MITQPLLKPLIAALLLSGCSASVQTESTETSSASVANMTQTAASTVDAAKASTAEAEMSFWDLPDLQPAWIDTSPNAMQDNLPVAPLALKPEQKAELVELTQAIANGDFGDYDSLLIAQNNQLVFESYFQKGRVDLPHFQASVTKSYTSLAIGRAIQLGYLTLEDLDKPIIQLLPGLQLDTLAQGVERITLHQLMTMRSGIRIPQEQQQAILDSTSDPASHTAGTTSLNHQQRIGQKGLAVVQQLLQATAAITPESQRLKYQGADPRIVMQVLEAAVPESAQAFINQELLGKLHIKDFSWASDNRGLPYAGERASLLSRDMIKLGIMVQNQGYWQGEPVIADAFLKRATHALAQPQEDWIPSDYGYGYFWYRLTTSGHAKSAINMAWGGGGQRIIAIAALDLVIVITGHDRDDRIMPTILSKLVPLFE